MDQAATAPERRTRPRWPTLARAAPALLLGGASTAGAAQYLGCGRSGSAHLGKRDCCDDAIRRAQEKNAIACETARGVPAPMRGGVQRRGYCSWESRRDDAGVTVFRYQAETSLWCR